MNHPPRILVVDDEPRNRRVIQAILKHDGYDVVCARDGYECLEKLDALTPDLILLDVRMPGLDGFETTQRIRSRESSCLVPVILLTGLKDRAHRIIGIESGCDDFISKPFHARELLARIRTILAMRGDWRRHEDYRRRDGTRLGDELDLARETQRALLPKAPLVIPGIEIWARHISSSEVSGDYFDVVETGRHGPVILAIADVSGKGVPAALLMANVQAGLRGQLVSGVQKLSSLMGNLNRLVCLNTREEMFVTMFIGEYWRHDGLLRYVRAGHELPYVASGRRVRPLTTGGPPLGLIADVRFEVAETHLKHGDLCCLYTDGVPDAQNPASKPFGHAPLLDVLSNAGQRTAEEIGVDIEARLREFGKGARQVDDMTLLLFRVQEVAPSVSAAGAIAESGDAMDESPP